MEEEKEKIRDSPIEQVRLTVPTSDDPSTPVLTFRTWVLGLIACSLLSFINQFFQYRQSPITISSTVANVFIFPLGKLMAKVLPNKPISIPGTKWTFSMNPGPFNMKEHVLISIFANAGYLTPYAMGIVVQMKAFYHQEINPFAAFLLIHTTQMLGYGFAGMVKNLLVDSPYMWWPFVLVDVSFFRVLHEVEVKRDGRLTRFKFFLIISILSFAYYIIPNFFFPSITALSFACWVWKDSVIAQQLGSGLNGLGLGSFTLDWATLSSFLGSPLVFPLSTVINKLAGFTLFFLIMMPIAYWANLYNARRFPIFSSDMFDSRGKIYNVSRILDDKRFGFDEQAYKSYSNIYLSTFYALNIGLEFATITAALSHVALFNGREIWSQMKEAYKQQKDNDDVHIRLMRKYEPIPQWWFYAILIPTMGLSVFACEGFGKQLQLPYWGILLGCLLVMIFILPFGVIAAITGQQLMLNVITELLLGYLYPGRPVANMAFKSYGMMSMYQALNFVSDLKLGVYMKIPPRSMFLVQVLSTFVSSSVNFATAWWLLSSVENICNPAKLPKGSPWTCPSEQVVYSFTTLWGLVGPSRIFAPFGTYKNVFFLFLLGAISPLPAWMLARRFPGKKWVGLINLPIILGATDVLPASGAVHYWPWFVVAFLFNYFVYRKHTEWWTKYNYLLSAGLDVGVAIMALLQSLALPHVYGVNWWGLDLSDHCPLATCPTSPGVQIDGCPVFL